MNVIVIMVLTLLAALLGGGGLILYGVTRKLSFNSMVTITIGAFVSWGALYSIHALFSALPK